MRQNGGGLPFAVLGSCVESGKNMLILSDQEFFTLRDYVLDNFGIDLSQKRVLIQGRLTSLLQKRGITSFTDYINLVKNDASGVELQMMLNRLTTNLTFFLREKEHFDYLRDVVVPKFEATARTRPLRVWSAGCSSGEEPYTLAMTLLDALGGRGGKFVILATDISQNVLSQAQRGVYSADKLKDVPAAWLQKYFDKLSDEDYQVKAEVRSLITFRIANLMDPFNFRSPFEVIFCRNVMIYFEKQRKEELIEKFHRWTAKGGYFFVSHSENIGRTNVGYKIVRPSVFEKE